MELLLELVTWLWKWWRKKPKRRGKAMDPTTKRHLEAIDRAVLKMAMLKMAKETATTGVPEGGKTMRLCMDCGRKVFEAKLGSSVVGSTVKTGECDGCKRVATVFLYQFVGEDFQKAVEAVSGGSKGQTGTGGSVGTPGPRGQIVVDGAKESTTSSSAKPVPARVDSWTDQKGQVLFIPEEKTEMLDLPLEEINSLLKPSTSEAHEVKQLAPLSVGDRVQVKTPGPYMGKEGKVMSFHARQTGLACDYSPDCHAGLMLDGRASNVYFYVEQLEKVAPASFLRMCRACWERCTDAGLLPRPAQGLADLHSGPDGRCLWCEKWSVHKVQVPFPGPEVAMKIKELLTAPSPPDDGALCYACWCKNRAAATDNSEPIREGKCPKCIAGTSHPVTLFRTKAGEVKFSDDIHMCGECHRKCARLPDHKPRTPPIVTKAPHVGLGQRFCPFCRLPEVTVSAYMGDRKAVEALLSPPKEKPVCFPDHVRCCEQCHALLLLEGVAVESPMLATSNASERCKWCGVYDGTKVYACRGKEIERILGANKDKLTQHGYYGTAGVLTREDLIKKVDELESALRGAKTQMLAQVAETEVERKRADGLVKEVHRLMGTVRAGDDLIRSLRSEVEEKCEIIKEVAARAERFEQGHRKACERADRLGGEVAERQKVAAAWQEKLDEQAKELGMLRETVKGLNESLAQVGAKQRESNANRVQVFEVGSDVRWGSKNWGRFEGKVERVMIGRGGVSYEVAWFDQHGRKNTQVLPTSEVEMISDHLPVPGKEEVRACGASGASDPPPKVHICNQ